MRLLLVLVLSLSGLLLACGSPPESEDAPTLAAASETESDGQTTESSDVAQSTLLVGLAGLPDRMWYKPTGQPSSEGLEFRQSGRRVGSNFTPFSMEDLRLLGQKLVVRDNDDHYYVRADLMRIWDRSEAPEGSDITSWRGHQLALLEAMVRRPSEDYHIIPDVLRAAMVQDPGFVPDPKTKQWLDQVVDLAEAGRPVDNMDLYQWSSQRQGFMTMAKAVKAMVDVRLGNVDQAYTAMTAALEQRPSTTMPARYVLGGIESERGNHQDAAKHYVAASLLNRHFPHASNLAREAYTQANQGSADGFDGFFQTVRNELMQAISEEPADDILDLPVMDFVLNDFDDNRVQLTEIDGDVGILYFWAHWCGYCKRDLPGIQKVANAFGSRVDLLPVATMHRGKPEKIPPLVEALKVTSPTLNDDDLSVAKMYGVRSLPTMYIVSGNKIRYRHVGSLGATLERDLMQQIESLLANPEYLQKDDSSTGADA